jgi:hypothetical protein
MMGLLHRFFRVEVGIGATRVGHMMNMKSGGSGLVIRDGVVG